MKGGAAWKLLNARAKDREVAKDVLITGNGTECGCAFCMKYKAWTVAIVLIV